MDRLKFKMVHKVLSLVTQDMFSSARRGSFKHRTLAIGSFDTDQKKAQASCCSFLSVNTRTTEPAQPAPIPSANPTLIFLASPQRRRFHRLWFIESHKCFVFLSGFFAAFSQRLRPRLDWWWVELRSVSAMWHLTFDKPQPSNLLSLPTVAVPHLFSAFWRVSGSGTRFGL